MYHYPDSHETKPPEHLAAILWIIGGLMGAVGVFMSILALVPKY